MLVPTYTMTALQPTEFYLECWTYISNGRPPHCFPYFDLEVGLAWSKDPESYAGGSIAPGRTSHAGQVKGDDPDEMG